MRLRLLTPLVLLQGKRIRFCKPEQKKQDVFWPAVDEFVRATEYNDAVDRVTVCCSCTSKDGRQEASYVVAYAKQAGTTQGNCSSRYSSRLVVVRARAFIQSHRARTERTVPESITCLSPSHPPDHEVVILLFNYPNE